MKKKLLGLILFWGLFAFSATASDSVLLRQKAQHATEEGNYEEAYQTYQKLSNQYDSVYQHVYSKEIEDLRATYQIDELELKNKEQANRLLSYFIGIAFF